MSLAVVQYSATVRACEVFVEGHLVERVDGLVRVSQEESVDVAIREELRRVEAVH